MQQQFHVEDLCDYLASCRHVSRGTFLHGPDPNLAITAQRQGDRMGPCEQPGELRNATLELQSLSPGDPSIEPAIPSETTKYSRKYGPEDAYGAQSDRFEFSAVAGAKILHSRGLHLYATELTFADDFLQKRALSGDGLKQHHGCVRTRNLDRQSWKSGTTAHVEQASVQICELRNIEAFAKVPGYDFFRPTNGCQVHGSIPADEEIEVPDGQLQLMSTESEAKRLKKAGNLRRRDGHIDNSKLLFTHKSQ